MAAQTPLQYYDDPASYGGYQFVTLKEVMDGMVLRSMDNDSYLKNISRTLLLYHAKTGIKELTRMASHAVLAIELTVGQDSAIVLPQDYVDYVRVSLVVDEFRLMPLDINRGISIATGYLQDHNAEILFDDDGEILTADSSNAYGHPYRRYAFCETVTGQAELDTARLSKWGEFNVDENRGMIVFSEDIREREIVLEYQSDGLQWEVFDESEIKVHKYIEDALKKYIFYSCIADRISVPANEKRRANDEYKTALHKAKKARANLNLLEINRAMRTRRKLL